MPSRTSSGNGFPAVAIGLLASWLTLPAGEPLTVPERTHHQRTSTVNEVRDFMASLAGRHPALRPYAPKGAPSRTEAGKPLLAWRLPATAPHPLKVYLNANIHAGEVEGKEAVQSLVRELLEGRHPELRRTFEFVVMPCYNADGTDPLSPAYRRHQPNPESGVGRRENARGLDLNRDLMKAQAANTKWFLAMLQDFDPEVVFDLHTTNGSYHGFHLTYAPGLALGADEDLLALNRDLLLKVRATLGKEGLPTFDYGNFEPESHTGQGWGSEGKDPLPSRWETFDFRPRYLSNYPLLQHRLAILSEAYVYRSFPDRIEDTRRFVLACLKELAGRRPQVVSTLAAARKAPTPAHLPLGATMQEMERATFELVDPIKDEAGKVIGEKGRRTMTLPALTGWHPETLVETPQGYLVDAAYAFRVRPLLEAHGLRVLSGRARPAAGLRHFQETGRNLSSHAFQGIFELTLQGTWEEHVPGKPMQAEWSESDLDAALYVPLDQPLGRLAFYLLDPRSPDGLVHWGLFHESLLRSDGSWGEPPRFPILAVQGTTGAGTPKASPAPPAPAFQRAE